MKSKLPPILYEDDYVIVFNKPAGLMVHPDGRQDVVTLADMLAEHFPYLKDVGDVKHISNQKSEFVYEENTEPKEKDMKEVLRPGIIHRLDTDTTGVLIVVKTQEAFHYLKEQFVNHTITKVYHAFLYGHPQKEFGTIDVPIGRSARDFRMYSAQRGARGEKKDAVTLFRVLNRFMDETMDNEWKRFSFVELRPKTGRTHQLRVHMKYMHHPIVSDPLYGGKNPQALGFKRTALHASFITFRTPDGAQHTVEAPYPADFNHALREYGIHANV